MPMRRTLHGQSTAERTVLVTLAAGCLVVLAALGPGTPAHGGSESTAAALAAADQQLPLCMSGMRESDDDGAAVVAFAGTRSEVACGVAELVETMAKPRAPMTEHDYYAAFRAAAQVGDGAIEHLVGQVLDGPGPDCRRVALLRVLYDSRSVACAESFVHAIRALADRSGPQGESIPSFAIRFLGDRARCEPMALGILEQVAFAGSGQLAGNLRRRAAAHWAAAAGEAELAGLPARMWREPDAMLVASVIAALSSNAHAAAAARASMLLGVAPTADAVVEADR